MLRTQVVTSTYSEYRRADVLASCKVAGYIFLVHRSLDSPEWFVATYAPVGSYAVMHDSITEVISALNDRYLDIPGIIESALKRMADYQIPLLSPETGIQSFDWKWREQCRFDSGEYQPVPGIGRTWPQEHYLHLSTTKTESDFVAYTPSEAYGSADRQVRLKFGKYLKKTFTDMSDAEIQQAVVGLRARLALAECPATLKFATDRATINDIFETQMYACDSRYTSCMHGKFDGCSVRPYHVYADSPDVAVAYVTEHGSIVSRSVVSTKDKQWIRAYSTHQNDSTYCQVLIDLLEREGYRKGELNGNRLKNLGSKCVPYIDNGGRGLSDCGEYWEVCDEGEGDYNADQTNGTGERIQPKCDRCEHDEDDCECSSCECCETMYYGDRECSCEFCHDCEGCTEHDGCTCVRCSECNEIVSPNGRYTTRCECERCEECGELDSECECEPEETTGEETTKEVSV